MQRKHQEVGSITLPLKSRPALCVISTGGSSGIVPFLGLAIKKKARVLPHSHGDFCSQVNMSELAWWGMRDMRPTGHHSPS